MDFIVINFSQVTNWYKLAGDIVYVNLYYLFQFQNIISFWQSVMDAMGPNIHVFVEDVKESNNVMMVTAFMHLGL
jgi:hypothetical protein